MKTLATRLTWDGHPVKDCALAKLHIVAGTLRIAIAAPRRHDMPPWDVPNRLWKLWEYEAVELFICTANNPPQYTELEFGPYGHWLGLRLDGVRNIVDREVAVKYSTERVGPVWIGQASVPLDVLPPRSVEGWRVNLTAVSGPSDNRRYLTAARLHATQPDFHRPDEWIPGALPLAISGTLPTREA